MADSSRNSVIRSEMELKPTEELVEIWVANDRTQWTDLAFQVIQETLLERLGSIPSQLLPVSAQPERWPLLSEGQKKFLTSTSCLTLGGFPIGLIFLFIGVRLGGSTGDTSPIFTMLAFLAMTISSAFVIIRREAVRLGLSSITGWPAVAIGVMALLSPVEC